MQLELKTIIDFGDDGPATSEAMNEILQMATERLDEDVLQPICRIYGARATTMTGWTSSGGDDEEEEPDTYEVVKFFRDGSESEVLHTGQTLASAKEIVNGPDTEGDGWFVGFRKE